MMIRRTPMAWGLIRQGMLAGVRAAASVQIRRAWLASCGVVLVAAGVMSDPHPAQAQFVCQQFLGAAGGAVSFGAGSVACGTNAAAVTINTSAFGDNAQAPA